MPSTLEAKYGVGPPTLVFLVSVPADDIDVEDFPNHSR